MGGHQRLSIRIKENVFSKAFHRIVRTQLMIIKIALPTQASSLKGFFGLRFEFDDASCE